MGHAYSQFAFKRNGETLQKMCNIALRRQLYNCSNFRKLMLMRLPACLPVFSPNNFGTSWLICMKFGREIMPLKVTTVHYFSNPVA
jgi:hypothetical protein